MALKFLSKKGWHPRTTHNIKIVEDAKLKHAAEEKKWDERRKQIVEERARDEFRDLQEKAGLIPKQERVEFLYDSGLAVGHPGGSDNFKEAFPKTKEPPSAAAAKEGSSSVPGALFAAEKAHQSANDAWRKVHSDPLLMIKQRQHEALSRIKNNPVRVATTRKQVEAKNPTEKAKEHRKKHHKDAHRKHTSDSEDDTAEMERRKRGHRKTSKYVKHSVSKDESHKRAHRSGKHVKHSYSEDEPLKKARRTDNNHVKQSNVDDESRYRARQSGKTHVTYSDSEKQWFS